MLKQLEFIPGFTGIICDVRADQRNIVEFMVRCGYIVTAIRPLYDSDTLDVVLMKQCNYEQIRKTITAPHETL